SRPRQGRRRDRGRRGPSRGGRWSRRSSGVAIVEDPAARINGGVITGRTPRLAPGDTVVRDQPRFRVRPRGTGHLAPTTAGPGRRSEADGGSGRRWASRPVEEVVAVAVAEDERRRARQVAGDDRQDAAVAVGDAVVEEG